MSYKGNIGTPVNLAKMPQNKATVSCRNCIYYYDKWCKGFQITCSSIANAKKCKKFKNKYGDNVKPTKKCRCSTCNNCIYTNVGTEYRAKYGYFCTERKLILNYNTLVMCDNYAIKKG